MRSPRMTATSTATRRIVAGLVLLAAFVMTVIFAIDVALIVFASILTALLLHGGSGVLVRWTGMGRGYALALFVFALLAGVAVLVLVAAPVLAEQAVQLWEQLPLALEAVRSRIATQSWGPALLAQISPESVVTPSSSGALAERATSVLTSGFGAMMDLAIICVIGVFLAADPGTYRAGFVLLFAPEDRERAARVLDEVASTLQGWLLAQLLSMAVIGALTTIGLWLLGVKLAVVLGVIVALLTFIPNLGPILAAAPAVLLALAESPILAVYVVALYVLVQIIEGNVTTPLIQRQSIALPPALILAAQLMMAGVSGLLGLALATPLVAVAIMLTRLLYVQGYLEPGTPEPLK
jgi:predicted PurR-regulated permease PerM